MAEPDLGALELVAVRDPGARGVGAFWRPGALAGAARSLVGARRVLVCTGFPVATADGTGAPETDGPGAARALGAALEALGSEVVYVTDRRTAPLLERLGASPYPTDRLLHAGEEAARAGAATLLERLRPSHLVAVEVPGRAADGRYYRMRGQLNAFVDTAVDELLLAAASRGEVVTIGVGDGGNEAGMGRLRDAVRRAVPHGERIATVVPADWAVVAGTSTWGGLALIAALAALSGRDLLPSPEQLRADLHTIVAAGAVDGISGLPEPRIDGLELEVTLEVLAELRRLSARG